MKKKNERRLHAAELSMLMWMYGMTRMDTISNEYNKRKYENCISDRKVEKP